MNKLLYRAIPFIIFFAMALLLWRGLNSDPTVLPSALINKPVPVFKVPRLDDSQAYFSHEDLSGEISLVNVWASWCLPCRDEHATLMSIARTTRIPIYGLNYKDNWQDARDWLNRYGDPYVSSGFDEDGRIAIDWGFYGVPETFLIDQAGIVRYKHAGILTPQIWRAQFLPLINEMTTA